MHPTASKTCYENVNQSFLLPNVYLWMKNFPKIMIRFKMNKDHYVSQYCQKTKQDFFKAQVRKKHLDIHYLCVGESSVSISSSKK